MVAWGILCHHSFKTMYMDEKLTAQIQAYINASPEDRDIEFGAVLLLKLNKNRILFNNITRRPDKFADKLLYELKKFLAIRLDRKTTQDIVTMERELLPAVEKLLLANAEPLSTDDEHTPTLVKGKRADHDNLPERVQVLWADCAGIYKNMKLLHENLKEMENAQPCDRYELLKQLAEQDTHYRTNMESYDGYKVGEENPPANPPKVESQADVTKNVLAARTYLSKNKTKLKDLKDETKRADLIAKMQERYNFLIASGNNIDDAQKAELADGGLTV